MKKDYSGILIISDIDGTLAVNESVSEENKRAIMRFTENGGLFTVASGRTPGYITEKYAGIIGINAPVIAINGSIIYKGDEVLFKAAMPDDCGKIIKRARELAKTEKALAYKKEKTVFIPEGGEEAFGECYKLLIVFYDEETAISVCARLRQEFGDEYMFLRSWNVGLEINVKGSGKGEAVKMLKEFTGAKVAVGVGNFENDIPLLLGSDIKIAVKNSIPELKEIADIVTVSCEENAIAKIIDEIEEITKGL